MLGGIDVVNDAKPLKGFKKFGSTVVPQTLFEEFQEYLEEIWEAVKSAPGHFIMPMDDTIVHSTIHSARQEVISGDLPVHEATSAVAAVIHYFIDPNEWYKKPYIGSALKSLLNSLEYKVLTDERYNPDGHCEPLTEPSWSDVYTLPPALHGFQGGALLVGSTEIVAADDSANVVGDSTADFVNNTQCWDNDYLISSLSAAPSEIPTNVGMGKVYHEGMNACT